MNRITFFNQYYKPLNNPPAKRLSAFAEYFVNKGWKVNVITGHPNYPKGKLFKGYNGIYKKENINGVNVYRYTEIPLANKGFIKRLINYLSFMFSSFASFPIILKSDIIIISTPPLFSAFTAFFLSKLFKKKIILDVRDLWPESFTEVVNVKVDGINKILKYFVNYLYKHSLRIIVISKIMGETISNNYQIIRSKIYVLRNFSTIKNNNTIYENNSNIIKIVFTGILTEAQDVYNFIKNTNNFNIEWHIVGEGDQFNKINELNNNNV